jgi:ribosomal-protein-alanine N-acetyltransferase
MHQQLDLQFLPFPELETERLHLTRITMNDVDDFFLLRSDRRLMQYISRPLAKEKSDVAALIEIFEKSLIESTGISWGIRLKDQKALVGTIGFWRLTKEHFRAEIGYMLKFELRQQGIMLEALHAVLDHGFNKMHLHSIEANVNPRNLPSIKLLEKAAFEKEGYLRENYYADGQFTDTVLFSLLNKNSKDYKSRL